MKLERIYFTTEDNVELVGLLSTPENATEEVIISVHGMQSNCLKKREDLLGRAITASNIAYFAFNNRGHELAAYAKREVGNSELAGSSHEKIYDSYYDIKASIQKMLDLGYTRIHLQGHSLGCTKIIYTYNKLKEENSDILNNVKSVILLSLVDIPALQKFHLGEKNHAKALKFAKSKIAKGKEKSFMPSAAFIHPMSVKTYLQYFGEGNEKLDFAKFSDSEYEFKEINNIDVPLFMRWGTINEYLSQDLNELVPFLKSKIHNENLDIDYINDADHGYGEKEELLAKQIIEFMQKCD